MSPLAEADLWIMQLELRLTELEQENARLLKARDLYREKLQTWADAYPEDMFHPLPKWDTESEEMQSYRTRASAAMGRHMAKRLLIDLDECWEEASEP